MTPEEIFTLRTRLFLSRREFGLILGVNRKSVEHWEYGQFPPNQRNARLLRKLAILAEQPEWQERIKLNTPMTAEDVRALRARLGLTQAQFAARIDVTEGAVKKWEEGKRRPIKKYVERMRALEKQIRARTPVK